MMMMLIIIIIIMVGENIAVEREREREREREIFKCARAFLDLIFNPEKSPRAGGRKQLPRNPFLLDDN